jgi:hypothetical protein
MRIKHVIEMNQNNRSETYSELVNADTVLTDLITAGQEKDTHNSLLKARKIIRELKDVFS